MHTLRTFAAVILLLSASQRAHGEDEETTLEKRIEKKSIEDIQGKAPGARGKGLGMDQKKLPKRTVKKRRSPPPRQR